MQLAFTTVDELFALLEHEGEALDFREAWPRIFPVGNCPPELMRSLVAEIVRDDDRFTWESDVHVGLTEWRAQRRDLADVSFTVVDLETTGGTPGFSKITEIGAVRLEQGEAVGTFSQLVDPGVPVPATITQITGITQEMVHGQPPIGEVLPEFVAFSRGTVLVAHNARFDLSFLDYELGLLQRRTFPRPALDTLRLARRLVPHGRASLSALAFRLNTVVQPCHRALPDAQATAEILLVFLARLEESGVTTLEEVVRLCEPAARRNYHKIVLTEKLPQRPGVYIMRDGRGAALYIGKAENLRRRARDHFLQRQAYGSTQALELLEHIDVVETGSEFAALLLEQRLIARHRPPYNSHGTRVPSYHYVKLTNEAFPRVYATPNLRPDGSLYAGPFRKASFAKQLVDCLNAVYPLRTCAHLRTATSEPALAGTVEDGGAGATVGIGRRPRRRPQTPCARADIGACLAPCREPLNGTYHEIVEQVRRVLLGRGDELDELLQRRQDEMVRTLAFERAARLQHQRDTLARALRGIRRLQEAVGRYAIIAQPARRTRHATLYGIAAGSIVSERDVSLTTFTLNDAAAFIASVYEATPPAPPLPTATIDEIILIHNWLTRHREAVNVVTLAPPNGVNDNGHQPLDPALSSRAAAALLDRLPLCVAGADAPTADPQAETLDVSA